MTLLAAVIAADPQAKSANGSLGLLVFLVLAVAVFFLLRSMIRHLHKVERINFDEPPADDSPPSKASPSS